MFYKKIIIVSILVSVTVYYIYSDYNEINLVVTKDSSSSPSQKQDISVPLISIPSQDIKPAIEIVNNFEKQLERVEFKRKKLKTYSIYSIAQFISKNGKNLEKYSPRQKTILAKELQFCGSRPTHNEIALEDYKSRLYFSILPSNTLDYQDKLCSGITDDLIFHSYKMLEDAAKNGDLQAAVLFFNASTPERMLAMMDDDIDALLNAEKIQSSHYMKSRELLIDSIYDGSANGALMAAMAYREGKGFEKNLKQSLGYFIAVNATYKHDYLVHNDIKEIKIDLNEDEIAEAEEFANGLITHWMSLDAGIW